MPNTSKIAGTNEILTAILSSDIGNSADKLKTDANGFLAEDYGVDLSSFSLAVVENTESQVHLPLPYYSNLEEATAKAIADNDIADVAGGDIFLIIMAIAAIATAGVAVTAVGAGAGVAAHNAEKHGRK